LPYYRQESINARTWQAEGQFTDMDAAQWLAAREAIAKALDYSLRHWAALTRHLSDGDVPVSNNHLENLIRPWAMGRKAWLFAGSELSGQRAAIVMRLVQSAKLNGHDRHVCLRDVLNRLPTHPGRRIDELLAHRWQAMA
jgi:hypothetical protein